MVRRKKAVRYVVTSGTRLGLVLHKGDSLSMRKAREKAQILANKGKKNVKVKCYQKGGGLSKSRLSLFAKKSPYLLKVRKKKCKR